MKILPCIKILPLVLAPAVLSLSCGSKSENFDYEDVATADTLTHHAHYLTITDQGNGAVNVDIADPWNQGRYLGRYVLVHRDSTLPENLPKDATVLRVPLERMAVYSSVHASGLEELGALGSIVAVADGKYFAADDSINALIRGGKIADIGPAASPSAELLAASQAQAVLRSPMEGITAPALPSSIIPLEFADYLETSPIARAEWILFLGELTGKRARASEILTEVIDTYSDLVFKASTAGSPNPRVLTESEYSGVWYVPAGESYMARLISDAGGDYLWADTKGTGSLALSMEKVAERGLDADVWILRTFGYTATPASLRAANPRYGSFRPVKDDMVYGCDTAVKPIFNDIAFHPERILADYVTIFHPEAMPGYELRYFSHK